MKTYSRIFFAAVAAAFGLASCAQEELAPAEKPQGSLVTVHFGAESQIATTKATLTTDDEQTFNSAWENGDVLSVEYSYNYGEPATATAEWKGSNFEAQLAGETGPWMYDAVYPVPDSEKKADFGSSRKQNGNLYNSKYDFMYGSATAENAAAGKTDDGKDIVFNMNRQTAIAYFHLTGTLDEDVVSAKLSVEGEIACLATSSAKLDDYSKGYKFDETESNALKEITITFDDGTAPKASDFKLWFNVLPTIYSKMTLTVETAAHTLTISRTADDMYEAGKLYKVVKEIPAEKWVAKTTPAPSSKYVLYEDELTDGDYIIAYNGKAMKAEVSSNRFAYSTVTASEDAIETEDKTIIWHISQSGDYWTIYNDGENKYAASTGAKSKAQLLADGTDDKSLWTVSKMDKESTFEFVNKANTANEVNANLRCNGTYGFACYAEATGGALSLYKREGTAVKKYNVTCSEVEGGVLSASPVKAVEGAEITLTATPDEGYEFSNDWTVKGADNSEITVTDGKFTMPAKDVTVSGSFKKISYTITKETAENGTFTVKIGDTEVETATKGEKVTLEATPADGYICDSWTVKDASGNSVKVSNNAFWMPASNVTVSVSFSLKHEDVKYAHAGTAEDPYSVSDVIKLIGTLGTSASDVVYARGKITKIDEVSISYKNATYYIGDDSTKETVQVFRGKYINGADFTSTDQIQVGDEVVIKGKVKDYNGTNEFDAGSQIVSLFRKTLSIDKASKTWASTATDAFVVKVTVNEGGDWTVSPTELSWATVAVDKTAGTITVTPNGENTSETANEAVLTVTHASDATLTKTITLKQNAAGSAVETKNGKITFGSAEGSINANEATVTGTDATGTKWTITTVGTKSFTPNPSYSQLGASKKPATSITIVGQNASAKKIESVSVKFGGFNDTAGTITIKVGDTQVGSGKLDAAKDVIVKSTSAVDGNTITISVTSISKGVKLYSIEYTYTE